MTTASYSRVPSSPDSDPEATTAKYCRICRWWCLPPVIGAFFLASLAIRGLIHSDVGTLLRKSQAAPISYASSRRHMLHCNCPPAEAVWPCTSEEFQALRNGSSCAYFKAPCALDCLQDPLSLKCRSCSLGKSLRSFCAACFAQGLNDVGCRECEADTLEGEGVLVIPFSADEHGCRPSAGYRWCEARKSCIRPRQEGLRTEEAVFRACQARLLGGDKDVHGCVSSAGFMWCNAMAKCIRPWEFGFRSEAEIDAGCAH